jgi:hypothetical protein
MEMKNANEPFLVDCQERSREKPQTFFTPTHTELNAIKKGWYVKLIWENAEGMGERMWVKITQKFAGKFHGELNNNPAVHAGFLSCGDHVEFEERHVAQIMEPPNQVRR